MEPLASKFLFQTSKLHVSMGDDCQLDQVKFTATKGLFVSGAVTPALADVAISLESEQLGEAATTLTDAEGKYSMGPFSRDIKYSVKAQKLGYVITETKTGSFSAKKLASVVVNVVDTTGRGCLVSWCRSPEKRRISGPMRRPEIMAASPSSPCHLENILSSLC